MLAAGTFVKKSAVADVPASEVTQRHHFAESSPPATAATAPTGPSAEEPEAILIDTSPEAAKPADVHVSGPIVALPAAHQLDMSVLDSLPATMRLELMREYGVHSFGVALRPLPSKPVAAKDKSSRAGAAGRDQGGGLGGSLRRIQEAGKSSRGKPKGPPPFRSIFDVPEVKDAAPTKRPVVQAGHARMQHHAVEYQVCCLSELDVATISCKQMKESKRDRAGPQACELHTQSVVAPATPV